MDPESMTADQIVKELKTFTKKDLADHGGRAFVLRKALRRKMVKAKQRFSAQDICDNVRFMGRDK